MLSEDCDRIAARVVELLNAAPPAPPDPDRWLDTRQAAEYLGIHRDTLRKLYRRGVVPGTQEAPNAKVFYRRSDLDDYRAGRFHAASNGAGTAG